jgi:hypothetical protein
MSVDSDRPSRGNSVYVFDKTKYDRQLDARTLQPVIIKS